MAQKRASIQTIHPDSPWADWQEKLIGGIISYKEDTICATTTPGFCFVSGSILTGPFGPLRLGGGKPSPISIYGVRLRSLTK